MIDNRALAERRGKIRALVITGLALLLGGIAAIAVFILVNIEKSGEIEDIYTWVFAGGMLLVIVAFIAFFHARRVSKIHCKYCGTKYEYARDVDFEGHFRRFSLIYTVTAKYTCHCSKCKKTTHFSRGSIRFQNMTLKGDLKEVEESYIGYFND